MKEQEANKGEGTTGEEEFVTEELLGKEMDVLGEDVMVGETLGVNVVARSNYILRQSLTPICPPSSISPSKPSGCHGSPAVRPEQQGSGVVRPPLV